MAGEEASWNEYSDYYEELGGAQERYRVKLGLVGKSLVTPYTIEPGDPDTMDRDAVREVECPDMYNKYT